MLRGYWTACLLPCLLLHDAAPASGPGRLAVALPTGATIPGLRFDATLELVSPIGASACTLWVRYWVSGNSIRAEIVWAEPHWQSVRLSFYPVSLCIDHGPAGLRLSNSVRKEAGSFPGPPGPRECFRYIGSGYPVEDLRYAIAEAHAERLTAKDLLADGAVAPDASGMVDRRLHLANLARAKAEFREDRLHQLDLFGMDGRLVKSIRYDYHAAGNALLAGHVATLSPRDIVAGWLDTKVQLHDQTVVLSEWPLTHHEGGRQCRVKHSELVLDSRPYNLPVEVEVTSLASPGLLRKCRMYNHTLLDKKQAASWPDGLDTASASEFDEETVRCRGFLATYWLKPTTDIPSADKRELVRMGSTFSHRLQNASLPATRLKYSSWLTFSHLLSGATERLEEDFDRHIRFLQDEGLDDLVEYSYREFIELLARWGLADLADRFINKWTDFVLERPNPTEALQVGFLCMRLRRDWLAFRVLNRGLTLYGDGVDSSLRFNMEYLSCLALWHLTHPDKKRGELAMQIDALYAKPTLAELNDLLRRNVRKCLATYGSIAGPDPRETASYRRIMRMKAEDGTPAP